MAHRRQKPGSVSGKAFNVSEATDTGRTFVRIETHRVIRQRIVQLISAVQWVALYHKVKRNKKKLHGRRPCQLVSHEQARKARKARQIVRRSDNVAEQSTPRRS